MTSDIIDGPLLVVSVYHLKVVENGHPDAAMRA
jgi:hypothetical protein